MAALLLRLVTTGSSAEQWTRSAKNGWLLIDSTSVSIVLKRFKFQTAKTEADRSDVNAIARMPAFIYTVSVVSG
jgi:hypothetical protein